MKAKEVLRKRRNTSLSTKNRENLSKLSLILLNIPMVKDMAYLPLWALSKPKSKKY